LPFGDSRFAVFPPGRRQTHGFRIHGSRQFTQVAE